MKPMVAVVGRPNVGKSTLFNKIAGRRISIVEDTPGITRDRIYCDAEWNGHQFTLVDTGGIEPHGNDIILKEMCVQAQLAIDMAHVIIFIGNIREGVTAADMEVAAMLQKSGKPVVVACNKVDAPGEVPVGVYEFYNLGLGEPTPVSSLHGMGVGDLLDRVIEFLPKSADVEDENDEIKVAIMGKPNAGKSSLINKILGENRVIVSDVAGTTRDAVNTHFEKDGTKYMLIDTAGIRRRSKVDEIIEKYSVIRALASLEISNVVVIMVDAFEGISEQDAKIAGNAHDSGKAVVIAVNKWDLIEKDDKTMNVFRQEIYNKLSFMTYAPIVFISAKTGQRIDNVFKLIKYVYEQNSMRIQTGVLNDILNDAVNKVQPPSDKGKRLKIYYMTQVATNPPTFVVFVNDKELAHFSYIRYLENRIRETFGLEGTPIKFLIRERKKEEM